MGLLRTAFEYGLHEIMDAKWHRWMMRGVAYLGELSGVTEWECSLKGKDGVEDAAKREPVAPVAVLTVDGDVEPRVSVDSSSTASIARANFKALVAEQLAKRKREKDEEDRRAAAREKIMAERAAKAAEREERDSPEPSDSRDS